MIGKGSRYTSCVLSRDRDGDSIGIRQRINATPLYDDRFHTITDGERLDILAHRYLGNADLWWIICDYNDIFFPLELEPIELFHHTPTTYTRKETSDEPACACLISS